MPNLGPKDLWFSKKVLVNIPNILPRFLFQKNVPDGQESVVIYAVLQVEGLYVFHRVITTNSWKKPRPQTSYLTRNEDSLISTEFSTHVSRKPQRYH